MCPQDSPRPGILIVVVPIHSPTRGCTSHWTRVISQSWTGPGRASWSILGDMGDYREGLVLSSEQTVHRCHLPLPAEWSGGNPQTSPHGKRQSSVIPKPPSGRREPSTSSPVQQQPSASSYEMGSPSQPRTSLHMLTLLPCLRSTSQDSCGRSRSWVAGWWVPHCLRRHCFFACLSGVDVGDDE